MAKKLTAEQHKKLLDLANSLSNDELARLFELTEDRFFFFEPKTNLNAIVDNDYKIGLNGMRIQVTLKEE